MCIAEKVCVHDTGSEPVMNATTATDEKNFVLATGQGDSCHLYKLTYKVVVPKKEGKGMYRQARLPRISAVFEIFQVILVIRPDPMRKYFYIGGVSEKCPL